MKSWNALLSKFSDKRSKKGSEYVGEEEERMEIYFYERSWLKTLLTFLSIGLTAGILRLVFYWRPHWMTYCTHKRCQPIVAKSVLLIDKYEQIFTEKVISLNDKNGNNYVIPGSNAEFENTNKIRYFDNKKIRYLWSEETKKFERLYGCDRNILCSIFSEQKGLTDEQQIQRKELFGENRIDIKVQSYWSILILEALSPFYIFQLMAIILWSLEDYFYYAGFILFMSVVSLISTVVQIHKNQKKLRKTVSGEDIVEVWKGGDHYVKQETRHLVPGDVIILPSNDFEMHCDVVLVNGDVIVDESMLTGESVPVIKSGIPYSHSDFIRRQHFKHIIFAGTKVIQTRYYGDEKVRAVVIRTSFQTAKGELVRSILFPKPIDFKFNRHIIQFLCIMVFIALFGFIYTFIIKFDRNDDIGSIIIKALDLITIVVPPELPAAMTMVAICVDRRLRANQVYCMSPRSINMAGCVDSICFDKTGTLTEDELSLAEVLPNNQESYSFTDPIISIDKQELSPLLVCMASCHSLTILNNKIIGDPLDIKMFESTEWILEEPEINDTNKFDLLAPTIVKPSYVKLETDKPQVGILRQFPFSSNLSRMSVITRLLGDTDFNLYVKGAPEIIATLCVSKTLPKDFDQRLLRYTEKSYRVLAIAYRTLPGMSYTKVQRAQREELESDLTFLGLVVMKNNLKERTVETIDALHFANIRTVMATGDNLITALSVAQECHFINKNDSIILIDSYTDSQGIPRLDSKYYRSTDYSNDFSQKLKSNDSMILSMEKRSHLALTGQTFTIIKDNFPDLLPKLIVCGTVFARMSPENKQQLIELLQVYGYIVSMTGDGANDVGALKASNCGISLSETEASVASPFTSKIPNISCVEILLREGRASLVSVFGLIKYMALYNVIAFMAVIILYSFRSNLTDIQNLYQDLLVISFFVFVFGRNEAYATLSPIAPPTSLINVTQLSSIILHTLLSLAFQMISLVLLWKQEWYTPHSEDADELDYECHDNYTIFTIQVFQYISLAFIFSKGAPYRKPFYTNVLFLIALIMTMVLTLYITVTPDKPTEWTANFFELETDDFTYEFRGILLALVFVNFILAMILEEWIVGKLIAQVIIGTNKETKYRKIAKECSDSDWICDKKPLIH